MDVHRRRRLSRLDWIVIHGRVDNPTENVPSTQYIRTNHSKSMSNHTIPHTQSWSYIHVPKTAGDSFMTQSSRHMPKGSSLQGNKEKSYALTTPKSNPMVIFLREPTEHVLSQFLECKYDSWGQKQTNGTAFPGLMNKDDTMAGFDEWIQHFLHHAFHPKAQSPPYQNNSHYGPNMSFFCYDPFNMQSRYLTSGPRNQWPHYAIHPSHRFPPLELAIQNLKKIQVVGIVEYFAASLCLFEYHAGGGHFLTEDCQRCKNGQLILTRDQVHERHSVPPHSISMISHETLEWIENKMTQVDHTLYQVGLQLFFQEMDQIRNQTGVDLLCRDNVLPSIYPLDHSTTSFYETTTVGVISNSALSLLGLLGLLALRVQHVMIRRQG